MAAHQCKNNVWNELVRILFWSIGHERSNRYYWRLVKRLKHPTVSRAHPFGCGIRRTRNWLFSRDLWFCQRTGHDETLTAHFCGYRQKVNGAHNMTLECRERQGQIRCCGYMSRQVIDNLRMDIREQFSDPGDISQIGLPPL